MRSERATPASPGLCTGALGQGEQASNGHDGCLLCGALHPRSWPLVFEPDEGGGVRTTLVAGQEFQGYENLVHGGVISALLDAAMTHCLFALGIEAVTGELRIRFRRPIACNIPLVVRAWLVFSCPPLFQLRANVHCAGQLMTSAEAKFMRRERL